MQRGGLLLPRARLVFRLVPPRTVGARGIRRGLIGLALVASSAAGLVGAEVGSRELAFLRGLRDRGYYEYATFEIDRLEARKSLPADLRATLDFERAVTQLESARSLVNPESQAKELDRATKSLDQFARSHPDHPLASRARGEQAQILLDRARVETWRLHPNDPADKQEAARSNARQLIRQARELFEKAFDQSKTAYERFPRASLDDPQVRAARLRAESDFLRAQINLAICTFEEAVTYEPKSKDRLKTLTEAVAAFEKIHVTYRSQGAGLRALLWEGKCFEEEGDTQKALGIYNELLQNHGDNDTVRQIRDQAVQFRLACLNQAAGKDLSLVVNEATQWLNAAKDRRHSSIGLGIRWQRALACERMAAVKEAEPEDHEHRLQMAVGNAREVSRFPGEFHFPALAMMGRLGVEQIRRKGELRDFATGFNIARKNMDDIESLKERFDAASGEERGKLEIQWREHLQETAARLRRVLDAADARTERRELNQARYFLAFVDYELGRNDEAAILADYAARRLLSINPELSRESARLALAAYEQEYEARPPAQRSVMVRIARPVAEFLIRKWPEQERANEARLTMARLCDRAKQHVQAAEWYANVTEGSEQYAEAQIGAGREYWIASQTAPKRPISKEPVSKQPASKEPASKQPAPPPAAAENSQESQIHEWTSKAETYLQRGIERAGDAADANGNPPDWLTVGKTELANLDIGLGRYDEAAKLLTDPPHAVVASVAVTDEATRPAEGVKGRPFASYVFQSLLRAQIGRHQVDLSLEAMQQLEKIAGASGAEGVTAIYVSLGKEIEKEIQRLIATNDRSRLGEVRKSFDKFLEELSRRSETMSYGSLLWIAETYTGLGDGLSEDPEAAREYFAKAAHAYEQLLTRAAADKSASRQDRTLSLQLRLANCLRRQGDYGHALEILRGVIAQRPKALDVQVAAAGLLQDWGAAPVAGAELRSLDAIRGLHDPAGGGAVWGWAEVAGRLERVLAGGRADNELREKYFEARYNIPACRRQFAEHEKNGATRTKALEVALGEINAFALVSADVGDESWRRLDTLYQGIETDLGRRPAPLPKPDLRAANAVATTGPAASAPKSVGTAKDAKSTTAVRPDGSVPAAAPAAKPVASGIAPIWILLGLVFGVAFTVGAVVWNIRRQQPTRASIRSLGSPEFVDLPGRPPKRARPAGTKPPAKAAGSAVSRKPGGAVPQKKGRTETAMIATVRTNGIGISLSALALFAGTFAPHRLKAEDLIDRRGVTVPLRGDVTQISRTEVVLKGRNNQREYRIPANEIERVRWQGEHPQLTQARVEARNGQFDKAIAGYEAALKDSSNENLTTDLEFLIARATASKALHDGENYDDAIKRLEKFRTAHSTSFRYFESLKLLAGLEMAKPDVEKANATMKLLSEAPWNDFKMEADNLEARVALARGQIEEALASLDKVLRVKPATSAELARRYEALLTKATCLQKQSKFQEAIDVLTTILEEAAEDDTKTLAETCVRLGDCYQAAGRTKEAILAYLRVDILFPKEKVQHAESLYYLSRLFAQDGKFDKAADAQARLQQSYPHSPWTAKLTVAPK